MVPSNHIVLDNLAISGITGSISISFWIIVFVPQIYENYKRQSSEGLSLLFVILWLAGDVFNVLGGVLQHVLPTMIILAIYYTVADLILLFQIYLYGDDSSSDPVHLSPANPLSENVFDELVQDDEEEQSLLESGNSSTSNNWRKNKSKKNYKKSLIEFSLVTIVVLSGIIGWYISYDPKHEKGGDGDSDLVFDPLAQFFGWLSAVLYLGSRFPQILLNYKRKSVEGISFLFFLCAVLGNLTYVISILSVRMDWDYLLVQSSWLAGSIGTLGLDFIIFIQFFWYNNDGEDDGSINEIID